MATQPTNPAPPPDPAIPPADGSSPFINPIPFEVRSIIYRYLLQPPFGLISTARSLTQRQLLSANLHPAILCASHQVNQEALAVLYDEQPFFVDCISLSRTPAWPACALAWNPNTGSYDKFEAAPAAAKVKRWVVVISGHRLTRPTPAPAFVHFCRFISDKSVRALTVVILPKGLERPHPLVPGYDPTTDVYWPLLEVVRPLRILRSIQNFSFRDAMGDEIPAQQWAPRDAQPRGTAVVQSGLRQLIQGTSPVEHGFRMNRRLLRYAQAFESNRIIKNDMAVLEVGRATASILDRSALALDSVFTVQNREVNSDIRNPYKVQPFFHPVEAALEKCASACDINEINTFKRSRKNALDYLEPQYQRIMAASISLTALIKYHKTPCGFFCRSVPDHSCGRQVIEWDDIAELMLLLEEYACAFTRDAPKYIRVWLRRIQPDLEVHQKTTIEASDMERVKAMYAILEVGSVSRAQVHAWMTTFRHVVRGLDSRMLEVRAARRELLDDDLNSNLDAGVGDFDRELSRFDEHIDWNTAEPPINVQGPPIPNNNAHDMVRLDATHPHHSLAPALQLRLIPLPPPPQVQIPVNLPPAIVPVPVAVFQQLLAAAGIGAPIPPVAVAFVPQPPFTLPPAPQAPAPQLAPAQVQMQAPASQVPAQPAGNANANVMNTAQTDGDEDDDDGDFDFLPSSSDEDEDDEDDEGSVIQSDASDGDEE